LIYAVCVPYYSTPEFPSDCRIMKQRGIAARDVLLCNRSNFHVRDGVQYDPHIETFEYINCQPIVRRSILRRVQDYDDVRILFRTRLFRIDGSSRVIVTGYYVVDPASNEICREAPVIKASGARFVVGLDAVDVTRLLSKTKAYRSCFTTLNPEWRPHLLRWIRRIDDRRDSTKDYVGEIQRLKKIYKENEFSNGLLYDACGDCSDKNHLCPLVLRRRSYGSPREVPHHYN
jgi:hypothetical protein